MTVCSVYDNYIDLPSALNDMLRSVKRPTTKRDFSITNTEKKWYNFLKYTVSWESVDKRTKMKNISGKCDQFFSRHNFLLIFLNIASCQNCI